MTEEIELEIQSLIYVLRGKKVMLDRDLASLYQVDTKILKRAVRRNIDRFPEDFMFELTKNEYNSLRSQIGTLKRGEHSKYLPFAFTEQGIAMLSGVLHSKIAIQVNIKIMRTFTKLREMISIHKDLRDKIKEMEEKYDKQFKIVFEAINQILQPPIEKKRKIGFKVEEPE